MDAQTRLLVNSIKTAERTSNQKALESLQSAITKLRGAAAWKVLLSTARGELKGQEAS